MRTTESVCVRYSCRRDVAAMVKIDAASGPYPWERSRLEAEALRRGVIVRVAELKEPEDVTGFMVYELRPLEIRLHRLAVHPDWRGLGIGRKMLDLVQGKARERRSRRLAAVAPESSVELCRFLSRHGFIAVDVLRGEFDADDGIEMVWNPKLPRGLTRE